MRGPNIIATLTWPLGRRKRCVTFTASSVVPTVSGQLKVGHMGGDMEALRSWVCVRLGQRPRVQEERPREHESRQTRRGDRARNKLRSL